MILHCSSGKICSEEMSVNQRMDKEHHEISVIIQQAKLVWCQDNSLH